MCQFHQHFTCPFCANIFAQKITKPNCNLRKFAQNTLVQKIIAKNVDEIDSSNLSNSTTSARTEQFFCGMLLFYKPKMNRA
jgi:hypothetical protein